VKSNKLDFVGIQETKKSDFANSFLESAGRSMTWNFVHTGGTVCGILVGLRSEFFSILSWQCLQHAAVAMVKNNNEGFIWKLVVIYGTPYNEHGGFINELHLIMGSWAHPTLLGGDFNLVRNQKEKSNGVIIFCTFELFNEWIDRWGLMEIKDPSRSFT
jgi:hypothetical protein